MLLVLSNNHMLSKILYRGNEWVVTRFSWFDSKLYSNQNDYYIANLNVVEKLKFMQLPTLLDSNNFATISDTCAHFTQDLY